MDTKGNVATNWKYFKSSWQNYFVALELKKKDPTVQIATLKAVMGKECFQIYEHLPLSDEEHKDLDTILSALTEHFELKTNVIYERYIFNSCKQENTKNIESYLARLRKLAATCEYGALLDEMLRDRIVIGISDNQIRARLLRESKLTLQKGLEICRSSEQANLHLQQMDPAESAHYIKGKGKLQSRKQSKQKTEGIIRSCLFCGKSHTRGRCPAYGTTCSICNKKNHLPERCRAKSAGASTRQKYEHQSKTRHTKAHRVHEMEEYSSDESIYSVNESNGRRQYFARIHLQALSRNTPPVTLRIQLDSGATCSIMSLDDYKLVTGTNPPPTTTALKMYDGSQLQAMGADTLCAVSSGTAKKVHFKIVEKAPSPLLSGRAAEALGLMSFNMDQLVNTVQETPMPMHSEVLQEYNYVFHGLGQLPGHYHIEIDPSATPVKHTRHRVPIPVCDELKAKISQMVEQGVLAKVEKHTPWISSMVVVHKPGKLRICLDPMDLNKAIRKNHHPIPTIDEVAPRLSKAKISVVDAKDGFLQVTLDEPSSYLTTFWTPFGRFRWLRMPFGLSSSPEEFERRLEECLEGLE